MKIKKIRLDVNSAFWILYFWMIALPLHASNKILTYLSVTGKISVFHIALALICVYLLLLNIQNGIRHLTKQKIIIIAMGVGLLVSTVIGFKDRSHIFNNVIGDAVMYYMSYAILLITTSRYFEIKSPKWILRTTFNALTINLIINVVMYFTKSWSFWGIYSYNGGRFGGGYLSLLVASVIYGIYDYLYEKSIKTPHLILHIGLALFCSMLAQSRTHVILCFIGCLVLFIPLQKRMSKSYFIRVAVIAVIGVVGVAALLNGNSELIQRILNMDVTSDTETTASRVITWTYYWRLIKQTPLGTGFGEILYFINPSMTRAMATATYYVDNAVAVVLYKGGWFFGVIYFLMVVTTPIGLVRRWRQTKDALYVVYAMVFTMLILSTMILTSQVIHTYAINVFIWTTIGNVYNKDFEMLDAKKKGDEIIC